MTELSADKEVTRKQSGLQSFPVEDSVTIYKGALVCTNAAGYLVPAADTAGYRFAGVAYEKIDNTLSGHSQGGKSCRVYTEGVFLFAATYISQSQVGQLLFVTNDGTVDAMTTNFVTVGKLVQWVSTSQGWVDVGQRAFSAVAGGPIYGLLSFYGPIMFGAISCTQLASFGGGANIGGACELVTVLVHSSLGIAAGGELTLPQMTIATQLPDSDPTVVGALYVEAGAVKRSTGV